MPSIKDKIEELRKSLHHHNHSYYIMDAATISDYDFDMLMLQLLNLEKQHPEYDDPNSPTKRVGGAVTHKFKTVVHKKRMYSLDNCYNEAELLQWISRVKKNIGYSDFEMSCELKYDGVSISLIYNHGKLEKAITRGDGIQGDDVTENAKTIKTIPLVLRGNYPETLEVRGEIILPFEGFEQMNKARLEAGEDPYMNPRNTASGSLKLQDTKELAKRPLMCLAYGISGGGLVSHFEGLKKMNDWGFCIPKTSGLYSSEKDVIRYIKKWETKRKTLPFETDGVVVKINSVDFQNELGFTAKAPRWAIAYKYQTEQVETTLESISYQLGRTGAITPVANLKPVILAGTLVKRASLHNADQIKKLGVRLGDTVKVEKGGEIIPKIVAVNMNKRPLNTEPIKYITSCPECGTVLIKNKDEAQHYCPNSEQCPPQIMGRIVHFISRKAMDIDGLGNETISLLYHNKMLWDVSDLYALDREKLLQLDRMAEKSVNNMLNGIEASKKIPFERVLFGLGIRFVGETAAKLLCQHFKTIDVLRKAKVEECLKVDGIGSKIAESVVLFFSSSKNNLLIERLLEHGLQLQMSESQNPKVPQILKGKTFVVSGVFEKFSRDEIKDYISHYGGKVSSSLSSKTDYLVCGDKVGPEKIKKAQSLNTDTINEYNLQKLIQDNISLA